MESSGSSYRGLGAARVGAGNGKKATKPISELCFQSKQDPQSICFTRSGLEEEAEGDDGQVLATSLLGATNVPLPLERTELKYVEGNPSC